MTEVQIPLDAKQMNPNPSPNLNNMDMDTTTNLVINGHTAGDDIVISALCMSQQQDDDRRYPIVGGCSADGALLILGSKGRILEEDHAFRPAPVLMDEQKAAATITKPDYDEPQNVVSDAIQTAQIELEKAAAEGAEEKVLTSDEPPCVLKVYHELGLKEEGLTNIATREMNQQRSQMETVTMLTKKKEGNMTAVVTTNEDQKIIVSEHNAEQPSETVFTSTKAQEKASEPSIAPPPLPQRRQAPKPPQANEFENKEATKAQEQIQHEVTPVAEKTTVAETLVLSQTENSLIEHQPGTVAPDTVATATAKMTTPVLHEGGKEGNVGNESDLKGKINKAGSVDASCNQTLIEAVEPSAVQHTDNEEEAVWKREDARKEVADMKLDTMKTEGKDKTAALTTKAEVTAGKAVGGFGESIPMIDDGPAAAEAKAAAAEQLKGAREKAAVTEPKPGDTTTEESAAGGESQTDTLTRGQRLRNRVKQLCTIV